MAINVDTEAEQRYMQELASKLGLNRQVMALLHQAVGMACALMLLPAVFDVLDRIK